MTNSPFRRWCLSWIRPEGDLDRCTYVGETVVLHSSPRTSGVLSRISFQSSNFPFAFGIYRWNPGTGGSTDCKMNHISLCKLITKWKFRFEFVGINRCFDGGVKGKETIYGGWRLRVGRCPWCETEHINRPGYSREREWCVPPVSYYIET